VNDCDNTVSRAESECAAIRIRESGNTIGLWNAFVDFDTVIIYVFFHHDSIMYEDTCW